MRILGTIIIIVAYIQGINIMFYFGILPAIGGIWTWSDFGLPLILGLAGFLLLNWLGTWIKSKGKAKYERQTR